MIFVLVVVAFACPAQNDIVFTGIAEHHGEKHHFWKQVLEVGKERSAKGDRFSNCEV
jgi:hypothetical protein